MSAMGDKIQEIGRIGISVLLLVLVYFLCKWAVGSPTQAQAAGLAGFAGLILGAELTYWLK